jgi:DNA-directed RNA polymerase II subunit RPB2
MSSPNDLKFISKDYAARDDPPETPREIKDDMVWPVVNSFFEENGLLRHQLEPCNESYLTTFKDIILKHREFTAEFEDEKYTVEFGELVFERPVHKENSDEIRPVTPLECINRDITYKSDMLIDIEVTNPQGFRQRHRKVHCGSVPVMVKSELCNLYLIRNDKKRLAELREDLYDEGGYFIVKGMPKIIACQERSAFNTCYSFKNKKTMPKYVSYTEVRSCSLSGAHSTVVQVGIMKNGIINVVVPYIDMSQIPMGILFQALGSEDELDMVRYIVTDMKDVQLLALLIPSFEQSKACNGQTAALHYIGRRGKKFMSNKTKPSKPENSKPKTKEEIEKENAKQEKEKADAISYATHLLSMEFLPHLGTGTGSFIKKRFYLGYMIYKFLLVHLGRRPVEDRDHFLNKRPATAGQLLSQQFFSAFRRMKNEIINGIERNLRNNAVVNVPTLINPKIITTSLMSALSNNAWGSRGKVSGISQNYDRFNALAGFSNARKIITPMNADGGKVMAPRGQHPSQAFIICPAETPEGKKCGLVKTMALTSLITIGSSPEPLSEIMGMSPNKTGSMNIIPFDIVSQSSGQVLNLPRVFVNGDQIGVTRFPQEITNELRYLRRNADLNPEISIAYNRLHNQVTISTEQGRICRPLFIVEKGKILLKEYHIRQINKGEWNEPSVFINLLARGFVELIDKTEEEEAYIVSYPSQLDDLSQSERMQVTHCELNPSLMYGTGASIIPYCDHNQSPRNTYEASMGKQAIGVPSTNFLFQRKGIIHVLNHAEHPIIYSKAAKYSGILALPSVQNTVTFVGQWYGFNQEDSIIMNQSSIDRGFMCSTVYMGFEGKIRPHLNEEFEVPLETECNNFKGNTAKLDRVTGIIPEGTEVEDGDVLIGRTVKMDSLPTIHSKKKNNISVIYKHLLPGRVHAVERGVNGDGYEYYRVVIAQQREPILGDKFASCHGQKGTVGRKYRSEDLPFTEYGETPDIIINPLAFPSRMTIAMLIEMLSGVKVSASSALNQITVNGPYGGKDGDPSGGKDDKKKCKTPEGGYGEFKGNRDGTPFDKSYSLDKIMKEIKKLGIAGFSEVLCYHPHTGMPQKVLTFKGMCSYQKLRHMVVGKIHARSRGGRTLLTRQPKEGRKVGGGFRVGHMERDCLLANGCPAFVRDRLMEQSDEYRMHYCKVCGLPATVVKGNPAEGIEESKECKVCLSKDIAFIRLPYATKLLMFEFMGMGIVFRVLTDPYEEPKLEEVKVHPDPKVAKKLKKVYEPVVEEMKDVLKDKKKKKNK